MQKEIGNHTEKISTNKIDWFAEFCKQNNPYKFARMVLGDLKYSERFDEYISDAVECMWKYSNKYDPNRGDLDKYMRMLARVRKNFWEKTRARSKKVMGEIKSLDDPYGEDKTLIDIVSDQRTINVDDKIWADSVFNSISGRDRKIMHYLAYGYTKKEIGKMYGISTQRVAQICTRATENMRKAINSGT